MRVLLTGASGFLGGHILHALLARGHDVRILSRREVNHSHVECVPIEDIADAPWRAALGGVDAVVHAAGLAHARNVSLDDLRRTNVSPVAALCAALSTSQHLVLLSSIRAQIGSCCDRIVHEDEPPAPTCLYGESKLAAEKIASDLRPDAAILRPVTVYGAGAKHSMRLLGRLARTNMPLPFSTCVARRSFVSAQNVGAAVVHALESRARGVYAVADREPASLAEIVGWLREESGRARRLFPMPTFAARGLRALPFAKHAHDLAMRPSIVRTARLDAAGWRPVHATTRDGVRHWSMDLERSSA